MNKIVEMRFGSYLYGTNTENSDTDIKGVYLPSKEECFFGKIKNSHHHTTGSYESKNDVSDIDIEFYSLQYFLLKLGKDGETVFLDMVHAPDDWPVESSWAWNEVRKNRSKFYTKNLRSYLEYCLKQAAKYGVKGSRIDTIQSALATIESFKESDRLSICWDKLKSLELSHVKFYQDIVHAPNPNTIKMVEICGKKFQASCPIKMVKQSLTEYFKKLRN